jgi:hypothetical protein
MSAPSKKPDPIMGFFNMMSPNKPVDDFFSMMSGNKSASEPVKPVKHVNIDQYMDYFDTYINEHNEHKNYDRNTGPNPERFITQIKEFSKYINKNDIDYETFRPVDKSKYSSISLDNQDFMPGDGSTQRAKIHVIKGQNIRVENIDEPTRENIFINKYPYEFRNEMEDGEYLYFTYVLSTRGLVLGKFVDNFEMGTGHGYLANVNLAANEDTVLCAGELCLFNNTLIFNFESGTYMKNVLLKNSPKWEQLLKQFTTNVLSFVPPGIRPFDAVKYVDNVIFTSVFPSIYSMQQYLRHPGNKLKMMEESQVKGKTKYSEKKEDPLDMTKMIGKFKTELEEGEIFETPLYHISLEDAQTYFTHYPYEKIRIISDGVQYINPYSHKPSYFIPIKYGIPTRWSFKSKSKPRKISRKSRKVSRKSKKVSKKVSRKSKKVSRKVSRKSKKVSRKVSRKSRKVSRKSRKVSRKSRKVSRKSRKVSRKSKKVSRK